MNLRDKDRKLLWTKAGNRCSYRHGHETCDQPLSLDSPAGSVVVGEECHIIGERPGSARYREDFAERDSYANAILLCPKHHTLIDDARTRDLYPVDLLHSMKLAHEEAVASRASPTTLHDSHFSLAAENVDLAVGLDVLGAANLSGVSASVTASNVGQAYGARLQEPVGAVSFCRHCGSPMVAATTGGAKPIFRCQRCGKEQ